MINGNMVTMRQLYKAISWLFLTAAGAAYAEPAPDTLHFVGLYRFSWSGITLAGAELSIDTTRDTYALRLAASSQGIVNLFTRHRSDTSASGRRAGNRYFPAAYESHYWTKNKPRHIKIAFDDKGVVTEETVEPPEDRRERPEVPHALKDGTLDPLTLLLAVNAGNVAPRVFDAKHLWEGKAVMGPQTALRTYKGPQAAIPYDLSRKPLAGMTQKEMKEYNQGEPPLVFYFSADGKGIPLYMSMSIYLGALKGALVKECSTWDECRIN